ncbi:MAG: hypothetical protein ACI4D8_09055 [Wujia sp.]
MNNSSKITKGLKDILNKELIESQSTIATFVFYNPEKPEGLDKWLQDAENNR